MISIVVAIAKNDVIGKDNKLIWHIPNDLKRFRKITDGGVIVMGRKTHESIGKSLPNRLNVILTRDRKWYNPLGDNCVVCYSMEEVLEKFKYRDVFIIGGSEIYRQFLPFSQKIYLTKIDKEFYGDCYFHLDLQGWVESELEVHQHEDFSYRFISLERQ